MGKCGLIFGLAIVSLVGCKKSAPPLEKASLPQPVLQQPATSPSVTPQVPAFPQIPAAKPSPAHAVSTGTPQFGWKPYAQENVTVLPSQGQFFVVPRNALRLRVVINASLPVLAGLMSKDSLKSKGVVMASRFNSLPCSFLKTAKGERECSLDPQASDVFVMRDLRESTTQPAGKMPAENKIGITLSAWVCMANCKVPVGSGQ